MEEERERRDRKNGELHVQLEAREEQQSAAAGNPDALSSELEEKNQNDGARYPAGTTAASVVEGSGSQQNSVTPGGVLQM